MAQASLFDTGTSATYKIIFDGGALGNPGKGYGSFVISGPNGFDVHQRLEYHHLGAISNNQAEYRTLIGALERLQSELGPAASSAIVQVFGDSLLVINQLKGTWKVKNEGLRPLHQQAAQLLRGFGRVQLNWHERSNSVRHLGH